MGNVDRADSILSLCKNNHRNRKWTDAHLKTCLKMAIDNAWIIFRALNEEKISLEKFIIHLALQISNQYLSESPHIQEVLEKRELSALHVPVKSDSKKYCEFCKPKKSHSSSYYFCSGCKYYLHIECFAPFHGVESKK